MIKKYFFLSKDYETQNKTQNSSLSPSEKEILATFYKKSEQSLNQLASNSNLANQEIITIINILELKDLIQQTSPGTFSIKR
jgi:DNA-binding MarR family transcriptional regulator